MKMSGDFYAQWFDDGPVAAPPESLVQGTLKWILKRLNDGLVHPHDGRPTTVLTVGAATAGARRCPNRSLRRGRSAASR